LGILLGGCPTVKN